MTPLLLEPPVRTHSPIEDATRREFITGVGAAALAAAFLAACGSDRPESDPDATREFLDSTGARVQVPVRAQRIVACHDINAGAMLLALGAPVVGISTREDEFAPGLTRYFDLAGIEPVGPYGSPDIEKVKALAPDLIVCSAVGDQFQVVGGVDQLREIAPVVGIDWLRPVDQVMEHYGELLGDAATVPLEDLRAEYEAVIEEMRALLGDDWSSVTVSHVQMHGPTGLLEAAGITTWMPNVILNELGVSWAAIHVEAESEANGGWISGVSLERMSEFDADLITVDLSYVPETLEQPLFQQLAGVQAGQVIELRELPGGAHYRNYIFVAQGMLDQMKAMMPIRTDIVA